MRRLAVGAARFLPTALPLWFCGFDLSSYRAGYVYLGLGRKCGATVVSNGDRFRPFGPFCNNWHIFDEPQIGKNLDTSWTHVFDVLKSPAMPEIAVLAVMLLGLFLL